MGKQYLFQPARGFNSSNFRGLFIQIEGNIWKADRVYELAISINHTIYQTDTHPYLADLYRLRAKFLQLLETLI